jgi:hypothetical protein
MTQICLTLSIARGAGVLQLSMLFVMTYACRSQVVEGCFPGCSLLLVLLEEGSLDSGAAMRYVVAPMPGTSHLPQAEEFSLDELPSVEAALCSKRVLTGNNMAPGATG